MYNSPFTDFASDDRGVLFKASVSYRFDDQTNAYFTHSEGYRIGGGNNFRVCTDEEITLLTDADPGNDPPQSGCIYEDQALIRPDTTTNYELGLRRSWRDGRFTASGTLFHVDWTDIQVAGETPFSAQPITVNGGGAVSRGVELAGAAGLTNALRLRGTWSYTRAALSQDSPGLLDGGADAFKGTVCLARRSSKVACWLPTACCSAAAPRSICCTATHTSATCSLASGCARAARRCRRTISTTFRRRSRRMTGG